MRPGRDTEHINFHVPKIVENKGLTPYTQLSLNGMDT